MSLVKFKNDPVFNDTFPTFGILLENIFGRDMLDTPSWATLGSTVPAVNVRETKDSYELEVAAPGMKKDDFKVTLENNVLTISSEKERRNEEKDETGKYTKREFSYHSFRRSFSLPELVERDKINAKYNDGVLWLSIPKKEEAKQKAPKQISIS